MLIKLGRSYVNPLHVQFIDVYEQSDGKVSAKIKLREGESINFLMTSEQLEEIVSKVNDQFIRVFAELLKG